jgi:hypothetical protein
MRRRGFCYPARQISGRAPRDMAGLADESAVLKPHKARCINCRSDIAVPATYAHDDFIKCGTCGMQHKVIRGDVLAGNAPTMAAGLLQPVSVRAHDIPGRGPPARISDGRRARATRTDPPRLQRLVGGADGDRTRDLVNTIHARSPLRHAWSQAADPLH